MTTTTDTTSDKLSFKEKTGYALGDTASNLFWMTFVYFGNFFYTDVFGLAPASMATLFFATRILDTVFDPLMGMLADRTTTRWGKFRPYLIWMVVPFGVCGTLAFITPPFGPGGKLAYAYVTYGLIGLVYSAINLPYSALMGVISPSSEERTKVSSFRFIGAYSAGLVVSLCTMYLVSFFGGKNQQLGFAMTVGLYALLGMVMWLMCFFTTKERVVPTANPSSSFLRDLDDVVSNLPWRVLFLLGIFTLSYVSIRNGCFAYYFKYYVGNQTVLGMSLTASDLIGAFFVAGSLATLFGTSLVAPIAARIGKRQLYMIMMGIASVLTIAFYFLRPEDVVAMFVLQILANLIMGPTSALVYAMYADASDYSEWKTGRRSTGLVFAASSFAQKMGWTVGGTVTGYILAGFGYQAGAAQNAETLTGLRMLVSFIPAIGSVAAALLPLLYSLDDHRMKRIEKELAERRESGTTAVVDDSGRLVVRAPLVYILNLVLWGSFAISLIANLADAKGLEGLLRLAPMAIQAVLLYFITRGLARFSRGWRGFALVTNGLGLLALLLVILSPLLQIEAMATALSATGIFVVALGIVQVAVTFTILLHPRVVAVFRAA
jgi:GPH family glycoside/pentoside/hexuronide:cation symporter